MATSAWPGYNAITAVAASLMPLIRPCAGSGDLLDHAGAHAGARLAGRVRAEPAGLEVGSSLLFTGNSKLGRPVED